MKTSTKLLSLTPFFACALGCGGADTTEAGTSNLEAANAANVAQHLGFECRCEVDACRASGLYDVRASFDTAEPGTLRLRSVYGFGSFEQSSSFVGGRAAESNDGPTVTFEGFRFVGAGTTESAEPRRAEDALLVDARVTVDRELLATGPEYDGTEVPPSEHASFGFVEIERDGELLEYTCWGTYREAR